MSSLLTVRKALQKPPVALGLLALAVGIWAVVLMLRTSPENGHVEAGIEFAQQHQGQKAEQEWREATRLDPKDPRPWAYLGEYYRVTHHWPAAVEALQHLVQLKPETPQLYAHLAQCSLQAGDERAAYGYAEQSLKREPNDLDTKQLFCTLLARTGEDDRRLELLRTMLSPDKPENQMLLAEALVSKRLFAEAIPWLEQILKREPDNLQAHSLRGMSLFNTDPSPQGLAKAQADLLLAAQSDRYAAFAHFYLGKIYTRLGQPAKAVPHLEAAALAFPDKREIFFALADAYTLTGQAQKATVARHHFEALRQEESRIDTLTSLCAAHPDEFENQLELATLLMHHKEYRKARAHLNQAQTLHPTDARVQAALQQLAAQIGATDPVTGVAALSSGSSPAGSGGP